MAKKNQSKRLTSQHKKSKGVVGIFGEEAKQHDIAIGKISHQVIELLEKDFPQLTFRYRTSITKKEINEIAFRVWFKDLEPIGIQNGVFTLSIYSSYK